MVGGCAGKNILTNQPNHYRRNQAMMLPRSNLPQNSSTEERFEKLTQDVFPMQGKFYASRFPKPQSLGEKKDESLQPFTQKPIG